MGELMQPFLGVPNITVRSTTLSVGNVKSMQVPSRKVSTGFSRRKWTNRWYSLAPRAAWGNHRITIHVFPGTQTYNRGGFFIHGGTHAGSAGCINLYGRMEDLLRDLKAATSSSPDCYIPLNVRY